MCSELLSYVEKDYDTFVEKEHHNKWIKFVSFDGIESHNDKNIGIDISKSESWVLSIRLVHTSLFGGYSYCGNSHSISQIITTKKQIKKENTILLLINNLLSISNQKQMFFITTFINIWLHMHLYI